MGNCHAKVEHSLPLSNERSKRGLAYESQLSLGSLAGSFRAKFLLFGGSRANSATSTCGVRGSKTRAFRERSIHDSSGDPFASSKTSWPVPKFEAVFLPEFPISGRTSKMQLEIIDVISKGAYGQVYKARCLDEGYIFALKVLSKAQIIAEDSVERVKDEVRIQKMVGHYTFIANSPRRWQDKKRLYVASDYISGGELYDLVQEYGSLPDGTVRILIAEVALAIDFLHNAGVIHRDIKASNVLLNEDGHVRLIDFGFAKWLPHGQRTNTICGTPQYIAPEVLNGQPYGHPVDWWSLGILMYFLLTNDYPTTGPSLSDDTTDDADPKTLSVAARDLLRRLLQKDPTTRLRSVLALKRVAFYKGCDFREYTRQTKNRIPVNENRRLESEEKSRVSSPVLARMRTMTNDSSRNSSQTNSTASRDQTSKLQSGTKDEDSETDEEGLFVENHSSKNNK